MSLSQSWPCWVALVVIGCSSDVDIGSGQGGLCPAPLSDGQHALQVTGRWKLQPHLVTGKCPGQLGVTNPFQQGVYLLEQSANAIAFKRQGSSEPGFDVPLVVGGGYCETRTLAYQACELTAAAHVSLQETATNRITISYRLQFNRNDNPLCPVPDDDIPMSCEVQYEVLGQQL